MFRTDHTYPKTVLMPLEPARPRDSDMGELSMSMPAPLPSGIEPLTPSPPFTRWSFPDEPRVMTDDEIESLIQKRPPLALAVNRRPRTGVRAWVWLAGAFVLGVLTGGLL